MAFHNALNRSGTRPPWALRAIIILITTASAATAADGPDRANGVIPTLIRDLVSMAYAYYQAPSPLDDVDQILSRFHVDREGLREHRVASDKAAREWMYAVIVGRKDAPELRKDQTNLNGDIRLSSAADSRAQGVDEASLVVTPSERVFVRISLNANTFCLTETQFKSLTQQDGWGGNYTAHLKKIGGGGRSFFSTVGGLPVLIQMSYGLNKDQCVQSVVTEVFKRKQ